MAGWAQHVGGKFSIAEVQNGLEGDNAALKGARRTSQNLHVSPQWPSKASARFCPAARAGRAACCSLEAPAQEGTHRLLQRSLRCARVCTAASPRSVVVFRG